MKCLQHPRSPTQVLANITAVQLQRSDGKRCFQRVMVVHEKETIQRICRCIRLDGPAARYSGRPKLPRQFAPIRNFQPRLFVPMPGNIGRPAFTFINLYIYCNLQRIINKNIHLGYVCIYFLIRNSFVCWQAH